MCLRYLIVTLVIAAALPSSMLLSAAPVEGDLSALQFVRDAQESSSAAFGQGSATFTAVYTSGSGRKGQVERRREIWQGNVVWVGENAYLEYIERSETSIDGANWGVESSPKSTQVILTSTAKFIYTPDSVPPRAARLHGNFKRHSGALKVIPSEVWHGPGAPYVGRTWTELLDPEFNPKWTQKILVETLGDRIVVSRVPTFEGTPLRIVCSFAAGGNVVESTMVHGEQPNSRSQRLLDVTNYQWSRLPDGRHRLASLERKVHSEDGEILGDAYSLHIQAFDAAPTVPRDRFDFSSLRVAPGTLVQAHKDGVWSESVVGKPAETVTQEILDRLAREAAKSGFSSPDGK